MRIIASEFVHRDPTLDNIAIPAPFPSADRTPQPTRTENRQVERPVQSVERSRTGEPTSFHFDLSPEYRRETILDLIARMTVKDGHAAVDALLLDAIRYFRPKRVMPQ